MSRIRHYVKNEAELSIETLPDRSLAIARDTGGIFLHDGVTVGGQRISTGASLRQSRRPGDRWRSIAGFPAAMGISPDTLIHTGRRWMVFGTTGQMAYSYDGRLWRQHPTATGLSTCNTATVTGSGRIIVARTSGSAPRIAFSDDDGETWTTADGPAHTPYQLMANPSPKYPDMVFSIGSVPAIMRSLDGGATWSEVTLPASSMVSNWRALACGRLDQDPVFIAWRKQGLTGHKMVRSEDNGATWTETTSFPLQGTGGGSSIAFDAGAHGDLVVVVTLNNAATTSFGTRVMISKDRGATWEARPDIPNLIPSTNRTFYVRNLGGVLHLFNSTGIIFPATESTVACYQYATSDGDVWEYLGVPPGGVPYPDANFTATNIEYAQGQVVALNTLVGATYSKGLVSPP